MTGGNPKKCIVLDLDNTLWGGIVGEDGFAGIALSPSGAGSSFIAFQQALLDLNHRGILLAINSKNNPDDALAVIRTHPNMILREKYFTAMRINWDAKTDNLISLAKELSIGLDSMVFLDDDPINRMAVREELPEVTVPELPSNPADYTKFLISLPYFTGTAITDEDKMRGNLYVTERLRREVEKTFSNRTDFLKHLGMEIRVAVDNLSATARLSQLTEKTNQFNTNKHPLTEEQISALMRDPNYSVFHGRLTDRLGDHGIVALAIVKRQKDTWNIEQFLLSCRVIGRGVEGAFLSAIAVAAERENARTLSLQFVETAKNKPAQDFVAKYFHDITTLEVRLITAPDWITLTHENI